MTTTTVQQQPQAVTKKFNPEAKKAFREYIRLDDEIKLANADVRKVRGVIKQHKETLLDWMVKSEVTRIKAESGDLVFRKEKTFKSKPTSEQQSAKMAEIMQRAVKPSPEEIVKELRECGDETVEQRLYRRKPKRLLPVTSQQQPPPSKRQKKRVMTFTESSIS